MQATLTPPRHVELRKGEISQYGISVGLTHLSESLGESPYGLSVRNFTITTFW